MTPRFARHNDINIVTSGACTNRKQIHESIQRPKGPTNQLTDRALPKVVFCSIEMPQAETTSNADSTKLSLAWRDENMEEEADMEREARDDGGARAVLPQIPPRFEPN